MSPVPAVGLYRVHVNHNMLDFRELFLQRIMDSFSCAMGLFQSKRTIHADLQIHINLSTKFPRSEQINPLYLFAGTHTAADSFLHLVTAPVINQLLHRLTEDVISRLQNKCTDNKAGSSIHAPDAHSRSGNTRQRTDGRKRVGTVMQCFCLQHL